MTAKFIHSPIPPPQNSSLGIFSTVISLLENVYNTTRSVNYSSITYGVVNTSYHETFGRVIDMKQRIITYSNTSIEAKILIILSIVTVISIIFIINRRIHLLY